jgi:hypothetical protein
MRGKQSGVTSDAMSGPYGTATGAITLEDTTETTRVTQYRVNQLMSAVALTNIAHGLGVRHVQFGKANAIPVDLS